ncbi:MAG: hypothetical protein KDA42_12755 [Planctomycetales bacterium]|nr:hypothetical protein [Planctomycetales bacterium]
METLESKRMMDASTSASVEDLSPFDLNGDLRIELGDVAIFTQQFLNASGDDAQLDADFNHDGKVGFGDLALLASKLGLRVTDASAAYLTDWADNDAALLAMEISGKVLPPRELYDKIHADLELIRDAYPSMRGIHHHPLPLSGYLLVRLNAEALEQLNAGDFHGLDELNDRFGLKELRQYGGTLYLEFDRMYNPYPLAKIYAAAEGVQFAQPEFGPLGSGDSISVNGNRYSFVHGYGDCLAGCLFSEGWSFDVENDTVVVVAESDPQHIDVEF